MPLYVLSGERFAGILLTAALDQRVSTALLLRRVGRHGGTAALLAAALVVALFLSWRGPGWLFSAWNPSVAVAALRRWRSSRSPPSPAGEARALPTAVVAGIVRGADAPGLPCPRRRHRARRRLLLVPPVRARGRASRRRGRMERGPLVLAFVLGARPLGPARARAAQPGRRQPRAHRRVLPLPDERHAAGRGARAAGAATVGWLFGVRGTAAAAWLLALGVVAPVLAHAARRGARGQPFAAALSLVTLAGSRPPSCPRRA